MVGAVGPVSKPFTKSDAERWYQKLVGEPFGWVIEYEGCCIGLARIHDIDEHSRSASLALGLFSAIDRGRGFGTEVVRLLLAYAFHDLGLASLQVRVLSFNARAIRCYERCGFKEINREPVTLGTEQAIDVLMRLEATEVQARAV